MVIKDIHRIIAIRVLNITHALQRGSADGGVFADLLYLPVIFALVLFALFITLVGFYRIGASYTTQQSALVGSVSPTNGYLTLFTRWTDWTYTTFSKGDFVVDPAARSAQANVNAVLTFDIYGLGPFSLPIQGQTYTRSERFYPGDPICDGENCHE